MDSSEAKIRASSIQIMRAYVSAYGVDFPSLLDDVGLSRELLEDPIGMVPLAPVIALFERAGVVLENPCFGIHLSGVVNPGGSGLLGKLAVTAPTVRVALQTMAKYFPVHMTKVEVGFEEQDGRAYAHWAVPPEITAPRLQYSAFLSAILVRRLTEAIGPNWHPLKCEFAHRAFDCPQKAERIFGTNLEFDRPKNLFVIETEVLDAKMPNADPMMFPIYEDLVRRWAQDLETQQIPDVVVSVRESILQVLSSKKPGQQADLNTVSQFIGVGARVLQRRLDQAGTSFEEVLMKTRAGLAEQLLKDTDRPLTDIAFDLGYSDQSVFTRAARRWFDMSPKQFRQRHRDANS